MNTVYVAQDPIDAELVRQFLAEHGIEAVVQESLTWLAPTPFPTVSVVRSEDAAWARKLIEGRSKEGRS
jgi:hypothetical protein